MMKFVYFFFAALLLTASSPFTEKEFVTELNAVRAEHDLSPVKLDDRISLFAELYNKLNWQNGYVSHNHITEDEVFFLWNSAKCPLGIYDEILQSGDIYFMSSAKEAIKNFLNSPEHRPAILRKGAILIGIDIQYVNNLIFLTCYIYSK